MSLHYCDGCGAHETEPHAPGCAMEKWLDDYEPAPTGYAEQVFRCPRCKGVHTLTEPCNTTEELLSERGKTHGSFAKNASYGQMLREQFRGSPGWQEADARQREALDYIAGKLSRILSGRPDFEDHWIDLAAYATLAIHPDKGI